MHPRESEIRQELKLLKTERDGIALSLEECNTELGLLYSQLSPDAEALVLTQTKLNFLKVRMTLAQDRDAKLLTNELALRKELQRYELTGKGLRKGKEYLDKVADGELPCDAPTWARLAADENVQDALRETYTEPPDDDQPY